MDKSGLHGTWLLVDAAGPAAAVGIIRDGDWLTYETTAGEFLEWFESAAKGLLAKTGLSMESLSGAIYASGPGSTLGLRLAAMFLRTWMCTPAMRHWRCLQYHNLELTVTDLRTRKLEAIVAPWRKDLFHRCRISGEKPMQFEHDSITPEEATKSNLSGVTLGRRIPDRDTAMDWIPYPVERLPVILFAHPELLNQVTVPTPYLAEEPAFKQWSSKRHSGK